MLGNLSEGQIEMVLHQGPIGRIGCEELGGAAAEAAMELLVLRLAPLMTGQTNTPAHGAMGDGPDRERGLRVFRIRLKERTGRFEKR